MRRALERQLALLHSRWEAPRARARACGMLEELTTTARHNASAQDNGAKTGTVLHVANG